MTAFEQTSRIEAQGLAHILEWMKNNPKCQDLRFTSDSPYAHLLQHTVGDILVRNQSADTSLDLKVEVDARYGNFFLETWSNRSRFTLGWMYTASYDWLAYYFLQERKLYLLDFLKLRRWAFNYNGDGGFYEYPEREQRKYHQLNDTWGRCVPIVHVMGNPVIPSKAYDLADTASVAEGSRIECYTQQKLPFADAP